MLELANLLNEPARAAGHRVYPTVNVRFEGETWIQPDFTVLRGPVRALTWVPADNVLLVGEVVSPSGKRRDRIDKPKMCATAGIPYFMRVEIRNVTVLVELFRLEGDSYVLHGQALGGQRFETRVPFPISFDPAVLLED